MRIQELSLVHHTYWCIVLKQFIIQSVLGGPERAVEELVSGTISKSSSTALKKMQFRNENQL